MNNDIALNPRRVELLSEIDARLDGFQLELASVGVPDPQTRRQSVESEFRTLTASMDDFELEQSLSLLASLMQRVFEGIEIHDVREFSFSNGDRMERCVACRYGKGFLSDGVSVYRQPHIFNRHLHDWKGFTKRHQVGDGKELVVVRHETQAQTPVTLHQSGSVEELSKGERQIFARYNAAGSTEERERVLQNLAEVSRTRDVGVRRHKDELLVGSEALEQAVDDQSIRQGDCYVPDSPVGSDASRVVKLLDWEKTRQGYGDDGTENAWNYMLKTHGQLVCEEWKQFPLFIADMGSKPSTTHILCRFRNKGPFKRANVRWMTRKQARVEGLGLLSAG